MIWLMLLPTLPSSSAIYLFSTEANKKQLLEAMERVEKEEGLVVITEQEWHEKYSIALLSSMEYSLRARP